MHESQEKRMPRIGLEPTHLTAPEPKSGVSTNFTTWADDGLYITEYNLSAV